MLRPMNTAPRTRTVWVFAFAAAFAFVFQSPLARAQGDDAFRAEVIRLTNQERTSRGLSPLAKHNQLSRAAQKHARAMADQDFYSHTGKDGSSPGDRLNREGYVGGAGENIAVGYVTPAEVVKGWMDSSGHRANILNPSYLAIGAGYFKVSPDPGQVKFETYWVQVFGSSMDGANQGGDGGSGGSGPALRQPKPIIVNAGERIRFKVPSSGAIRRYVVRGKFPKTLRFNQKTGRFAGTIRRTGNYRIRVVGVHANGRTDAVRVVIRVR